MRIGYLSIGAIVEPANEWKQIEIQNTLSPYISSLGYGFTEFFKNTGYVRALYKWEVQLERFTSIDYIYNSLLKLLSKDFSKWHIQIIISIHEKGG